MFLNRLVKNSFKSHCGRPKKNCLWAFDSSAQACIHTLKSCHLRPPSPPPHSLSPTMCEPERRIKAVFPLILNLGLCCMNMLMYVQKPHREDRRWNMSFHLNWWHYWVHGGWKWPGSTLMLIQRWHNKSQAIWLGRLNWRLLLENIQISCSQTSRTLSSFSVEIPHFQFC